MLWTISKDFTFHVNGVDYAIPGFMLWAAISYSVVGSLLSYSVGRALVRLNSDRYAREADLRFALVDINEHIDGIALAGGRGRRAPPRRDASRQRRDRDAPARTRPHESHLGDGGIRLDHRHRADPDRRAAVLQPEDELRRHDDGGGRVHAGAGLAALVRRQLQRARGLAGHAAARGELQGGADRQRAAAQRRERDRIRRGRAGRDDSRESPSRLARRAESRCKSGAP